jgi:hypothetical protein
MRVLWKIQKILLKTYFTACRGTIGALHTSTYNTCKLFKANVAFGFVGSG